MEEARKLMTEELILAVQECFAKVGEGSGNKHIWSFEQISKYLMTVNGQIGRGTEYRFIERMNAGRERSESQPLTQILKLQASEEKHE